MMPTSLKTRFPAAVAVAAALSVAVLSARADDPTPSPDAAIEPAISHPSLELKLAFAAPGLVSDVAAREGDHVKAGQPLAQQDDREEQVALRSLELDANSTTAEIEYERADAKDKQVILERKQRLFNEDGHNASQSELDEAALAVELAKAQIAVAELKHNKAVMDAQKQKIKVELMQMRSPIDGVVETVISHAGEMADPANKDGSIVVVKNDPLWVEIHPATDRALKLAMGQELQVRYAAPPGERPTAWQPAKVIYFAPRADAGSKTELVRLELPNPQGQRSGLSMEVRLPANVAAVAASTPADQGPALPPAGN